MVNFSRACSRLFSMTQLPLLSFEQVKLLLDQPEAQNWRDFGAFTTVIRAAIDTPHQPGGDGSDLPW
jgi:hypothetical protein